MPPDRLILADGTVLLRDADGAPITVRVSEQIEESEQLYACGEAGMAKAALMCLGVWLDQLMARVEVALAKAEGRRDN